RAATHDVAHDHAPALALKTHAEAAARAIAPRLALDREAHVLERRRHVDLARRAYPGVEEIAHRHAGRALDDLLHGPFRHRHAARAVIAPERREHRVERRPPAAARANLEIEHRAHELPFSVVAHAAVRRVLVGA